ncbi:MAG: beta-galactosidase [Armatimonadota bacterium]|nr:MAG: beta-galactosidase [Armatimonadota bacterium]
MKRITCAAAVVMLVASLTAAAAEPEYACPQLRQAPTIDGNSDEWPDLQSIALDRADQFHAIVPGAWSGPQDLNARLSLAWDRQGLYVAATVADDRFAQPEKTWRTWLGDSLQIAFDPLMQPGGMGYREDDQEFTIALVDGEPQVWLQHPRRGESEGVARGAEAAIEVRPVDRGCICTYEVFLPWSALAPLAPVIQDACRFSVLVNDNDGEGREGWLEWTPGIGLAPKNPQAFGRLAFATAPEAFEAYVRVPEPVYNAGDEVGIEVGLASPEGRAAKVTVILRGDDGRTLWSESRTSQLKRGANRVDFAWATSPDLAKGRYSVAVAASNSLPAATAEASFTMLSSAAILRKVEELAALHEDLSDLIRRGAEKGQRLAYPRATNEVVRRFIGYLRADIEEGRLEVSEWNADYLLDSCRRAIDEARQCLDDPSRELTVPEYDMTKLEVRDGSFYSGDHPVFLFGSLCWSAIANDIPNLGEMGFNFVEQEMGPNSVVMGPDELSWDRIREFEAILDRAAEHNVAIDFLLSTHYFPGWVYDAFPGTSLERQGGEGGFIHQCLEHPVSRKVAEEWLRAFIPRIKDRPALHSYILANEPLYVCYCDHCAVWFRDWVRSRYDSLDALNEAWGTALSSWGEITPPRKADAASRAVWYDWCRFNQRRFSDYFVWMKKIIREMDAEHPIHIKVMNWTIFDEGGFRLGIDREDLQLRAEEGISGCDMAMTPSTGDLGLSFGPGAMGYDFMRSVCPDRPVVDSEWHIIYNDPRRYPAPAGRASLWMSCLHGMNGANVWVWGRGQEAFDDGAILYHAGLLEALARTTLDLRRLMPEVTKLQRARAPIALYMTQASRSGTRQEQELYAAYTGALFLGRPVNLITDRQLAHGVAAQYDVIVVAGSKYAPDESHRALEQYVRGGGTLVITEGALAFDEMGRERTDAPLVGGRTGGVRLGAGRVVRVPTDMTGREWFDKLGKVVARVIEPQGLTVHGVGGGPAWGVETRTVGDGGCYLVYALNLNPQPTSIRLRARGGRIAAVTDLVAMQPARATVHLEPYEVALVSVETSDR